VNANEARKDATAPLAVSTTLSKLANRYGTERVLAQAKRWVEFIEHAIALADEGPGAS
jgi:hypothetical protein